MLCYNVNEILYRRFVMEKSFGEFLREKRQEKGFTQKELAKILGLNQSSISDWENDISRPDLETIFELCKLFNVTIYDLLGIDEYTFQKI